jgi:putative DNA primase/helicase
MGDTGRAWVGRCPAHSDQTPSLSVADASDGRVLVKCFAGCSFHQIVAALGLEPRDFYPGRAKVAPAEKGVTVNRLAFEKRLDAKWLREFAGVEDTKWDGANAVGIPYRDATGAVLFTRIRHGLSGTTGTHHPKGVGGALYGLWLLELFRQRGGPLLIVEGETDCWALWSHGFNALGVPGASNKKAVDSAAPFAGFDRVYLWREPGKSGDTFVATVPPKLKAVGYDRPVYVVAADGAKDPADIQAREPAKFPERMRAFLATGQPLNPPAAESVGPPPGAAPQTVQRLAGVLEAAGVCEWGRYERTEQGLADRLVHLHGADLRWVSLWQRWYVWDGRRWLDDLGLEVVERAKRTVLSLWLEAQLAPGEAARREAEKFYTKCQTARTIEATVRLARSAGGVGFNHEHWDDRPWLLNCPNGTVELDAGRLRSHRREDLLTQMCPTGFDPDARCPGWERFLAGVFPADPDRPADGGDPELIGYVRKLFGYCLTGDVSLHQLPIFWGKGSNGKSTLLWVVSKVLGQGYAMQAPDNFLMVRNQDPHPTEVASLFRRRLVVTIETGQGRPLDEAMVKKLTGGDRLTARRMRENFWEFDATHKLILCTNHMPRVRGNDAGIWRRLLLVPFAARFWDPDKGESGSPEMKVVEGLRERLLETEAAGILAWMVRGCVEWRKTGRLSQPARVREATKEYRDEEDTLGQFLTEKFAPAGADSGVLLRDLYRDYCHWCEVGHERPLNLKNLTAELRNRGHDCRVGGKNLTRVYGLAPAEPVAVDTDDFGY